MRSTKAIASKNRALVPRVPSLMSAEPGSDTAKAPFDETRVELDQDKIDSNRK